jgi:hypothetical protein
MQQAWLGMPLLLSSGAAEDMLLLLSRLPRYVLLSHATTQTSRVQLHTWE